MKNNNINININNDINQQKIKRNYYLSVCKFNNGIVKLTNLYQENRQIKNLMIINTKIELINNEIF